MTDEAKDAEIGRITKQYAETKKTMACLNNSLYAVLDGKAHPSIQPSLPAPSIICLAQL